MKKILFRVFSCHFFSVCFLNALQSDNNSNRVYVRGHKYILGPSQSLSRAQNIFMPANINSIVILLYGSSNPLFYFTWVNLIALKGYWIKLNVYNPLEIIFQSELSEK